MEIYVPASVYQGHLADFIGHFYAIIGSLPVPAQQPRGPNPSRWI